MRSRREEERNGGWRDRELISCVYKDKEGWGEGGQATYGAHASCIGKMHIGRGERKSLDEQTGEE